MRHCVHLVFYVSQSHSGKSLDFVFINESYMTKRRNTTHMAPFV